MLLCIILVKGLLRASLVGSRLDHKKYIFKGQRLNKGKRFTGFTAMVVFYFSISQTLRTGWMAKNSGNSWFDSLIFFGEREMQAIGSKLFISSRSWKKRCGVFVERMLSKICSKKCHIWILSVAFTISVLFIHFTECQELTPQGWHGPGRELSSISLNLSLNCGRPFSFSFLSVEASQLSAKRSGLESDMTRWRDLGQGVGRAVTSG